MPFQNTIKATFNDPAWLAAKERTWGKARRPTEVYGEAYCEWCEDMFEFRLDAPNRRRFCSDRCRSSAEWDRRKQRNQDIA